MVDLNNFLLQDPSPAMPAAAHADTGQDASGPKDINAAPTLKQKPLRK